MIFHYLSKCILRYNSLTTWKGFENKMLCRYVMQGQWQIQVARHFGVHVFTIERLVRHPRETGRVADRPCFTSQRWTRPVFTNHS